MDNSRSPRYPNIALSDAISKVRMVYEKEHMSQASPAVVAEAMGYSGINGASLKMLSSLRKYGLLEGRGDDLRVSKDGQTLIIDQPGSPDYREAIRRTALKPELFSDLKRQFPGQASDRNISIFLEKQGFKPDAAALAAKNFRETMALVDAEPGAYNQSGQSEEPQKSVGQPEMRAESQRSSAQANEEARWDFAPRPAQTEIKVLLDGNHLKISAWVDLEGLKRLQRILKANAELLEDAEKEGSPQIRTV